MYLIRKRLGSLGIQSVPSFQPSTLRTRFFRKGGSNDRPPITQVYVRRGKKGNRLEGNVGIVEMAKGGVESVRGAELEEVG